MSHEHLGIGLNDVSDISCKSIIAPVFDNKRCDRMKKTKYARGTSLEQWCISEGRMDILEQFDYERNYPKLE